MKRSYWKRSVGIVLLAVVLLGGWWFGQLIWGKPRDIDNFFERAFIRLALQSPELLTRIGLLESVGLDFHNSRLTDASDEFAAEILRREKSELSILRSYDRASLTPAQRLSADVADYYWEQEARGERFLLHDYPVNQLFGVQSELPAFMINVHPVRSLADAKRYNERLGAFGAKFDQVLAGLKNREAHGIVAPRFVIDKVLSEMKAFVAPPAREHALYTSLAGKLGKLDSAADAERQSILAVTEQAIERSVYPAYRAMIAFHEGLLARATTDDGVWKLPDGAAFYAHRLRGNTTTDLTPEEVHQLGLREVARIDGELRAAFAAAGLTGKSAGELLAELSKDPRQRYPDNSVETRREVLSEYQRILDEVNAKIAPAFPTRPKAGLTVQAVEPFREKTASAAFYQPGTLDGSRKGIFFVNTRNLPEESPKFAMKTVAYHEGIPGHYFQGAIAQEVTGVPTFRKIVPFTAYLEGWGLYAEKLAFEQGLYKDDPYGNLGRLQWELVRAVRLVVDTGIHHKRWTRAQAIEYMEQATGVSHPEVVAEVERYIVLPGQACAYKVGELRIIELRERARTALGTRFDLGKFHDAVLRNGALPLAVLERVVAETMGTQMNAEKSKK